MSLVPVPVPAAVPLAASFVGGQGPVRRPDEDLPLDPAAASFTPSGSDSVGRPRHGANRCRSSPVPVQCDRVRKHRLVITGSVRARSEVPRVDELIGHPQGGGAVPHGVRASL